MDTIMNIQYYLIHGINTSRRARMTQEFEKGGLDADRVKWMCAPNGDEITDELRQELVCKDVSLHPNLVSCTYKHYLCLKDMVENDYEYGVVFEDNLYFHGNIPETVERYIHELDTLYPSAWDILFDTNWKRVQDVYETTVTEDIHVYPKSNAITQYVHGGSRLAQFYIVRRNSAKKLYDHYLPFDTAPDHWMNHLFRKLGLRSFWSEPSISNVFPHASTVR